MLEQFKQTKMSIITIHWIVHSILSIIAERAGNYVMQLSAESQRLDDEMFGVQTSGLTLQRIGACRKLMISLASNLWSKRNVLERLKTSHDKRHPLAPSKEEKIYYRDVEDSLQRMEQRLHSAKELLQNLYSTYQG